MQFDTKIAIIIRDDLATLQKLNVTAFLTSGIVGAHNDLLGELYEDAAGSNYSALAIQPMIVLAAKAPCIKASTGARWITMFGFCSISKTCLRQVMTWLTARLSRRASRTTCRLPVLHCGTSENSLIR